MFKDVLCAVDLGDEHSWKKALPKAIELRGDNGNLHLLTVVPEFGLSMISQYFPDNFEDKTLAATKDALRDFIDKNVPKDVSCRAIVAQGRAYEQILVVDNIVFGSTAERQKIDFDFEIVSIEVETDRRYSDRRYEGRCRKRTCRGPLTPFARYCPWCRTKLRRPWKLPGSADRCPSCKWGVDNDFWRHCPWCARGLST